jgi:hypothetical protein
MTLAVHEAMTKTAMTKSLKTPQADKKKKKGKSKKASRTILVAKVPLQRSGTGTGVSIGSKERQLNFVG